MPTKKSSGRVYTVVRGGVFRVLGTAVLRELTGNHLDKVRSMIPDLISIVYHNHHALIGREQALEGLLSRI
jgi:hypothetical protein